MRWERLENRPEGGFRRVYHDIPTSGEGSSGTNYAETTFLYDSKRRIVREKSPEGTIKRTVFQPFVSRIASEWVGTDDTGATPTDPAGSGSNNMVKVLENQYDHGQAGGDGNLTKVTRFVDGTETRVTEFGYDWRDRRTSAEGEEDFFEAYGYDNQNRHVETERRVTDASGDLVWRTKTHFDTRGQVFRTERQSSDGDPGPSLADNFWFDPTGNLLMKQAAGRTAVEKSAFDGIGRQVKSYVSHDSTLNYDSAKSVTQDKVWEQREIEYDDASNIIFQQVRQRFHDATNDGELNGPDGSQPKARISYRAQWPDAVGRPQAIAEYGTHGGTPPNRPSEVPDSSDNVPVTRTKYNSRGEPFKSIDAEGSETLREWDDAARLVKVIENETDGSPGAETDRTSEFEYNGDNNLTKRTEINPDTGNQETRYVYGVGQNSDLHSNSLLHAVIYPDSSDPADPFSGTDNVRFEYNRQGQITKKTDQAGTVHEYVYDKLAREVQDRATSLGSGVNGTVRRIERTYKNSGELEKVTSYDNADVGNGVVLDQIEYTYDKFQQPLKYRQEHDGAVGAGTPEVAYTYADGSNNDKRTLSVIYPDLREIDFDYGTSGSDDDLLSRFGGLEDAGGSLVKYTYFGVDTFCEQEYPENAVKLTYIGTPDSNGDPYTGLDRFGRVTDQRWHKGTTDLERLDYTYSRLGNRTERDNTVAATGQDEEYTYDGLYRLGNMGRGTFTSGTLNKDFEQDWGYDPLGNWKNFKQGDGSSWNLDQSRAHTKANEIEKIDNDANVMSHDPAGNLTKSPRPGNWTASYDYVWDAWNRLVEVTGRGTNVVFAYNGEHKRITKTADSITRHFYYSIDWQILEERLDEETEPLRQYVWNPNPWRMDDLILRDEGAEGSGSSSSGTQQRLYALNDLMNVTAIVDDDGSVVERYGYTPFGESRVMDPSFGPRTSSDYDWELRYKTYPLDLESGLYQPFLYDICSAEVSRERE